LRGPKKQTRRRRKGGGRKRQDGEREPSGRLSRKKSAKAKRDKAREQEIQSVAIDARMRHFRLSIVDASDPLAGSPLRS
jgi:hypothetical protein